MKHTKSKILGLACLFVLLAAPSWAAGSCSLPQLANQRENAATIQHLEHAWSMAFLTGDTQLEGCLLSPDYREIRRNGELKYLRDELEMAAKNRGKNLKIPRIPEVTVMIHENVAVAYALSSFTAPDGKLRATRSADFFIWKDGEWHAFFSQQTPVAP
ncbi:MAG TPA: nuclear transport factor 2 family protein [Candidatus Acidoferrales bacterium]|nr:nuclear transport factor 2 family protein [Candidatus Acidoferrales bacterium]